MSMLKVYLPILNKIQKFMWMLKNKSDLKMHPQLIILMTINDDVEVEEPDCPNRRPLWNRLSAAQLLTMQEGFHFDRNSMSDKNFISNSPFTLLFPG